jgi:hypothetical protein
MCCHLIFDQTIIQAICSVRRSFVSETGVLDRCIDRSLCPPSPPAPPATTWAARVVVFRFRKTAGNVRVDLILSLRLFGGKNLGVQNTINRCQMETSDNVTSCAFFWGSRSSLCRESASKPAKNHLKRRSRPNILSPNASHSLPSLFFIQ